MVEYPSQAPASLSCLQWNFSATINKKCHSLKKINSFKPYEIKGYNLIPLLHAAILYVVKRGVRLM
jgi:hypothetical protein